jgi:hypothetical protein
MQIKLKSNEIEKTCFYQFLSGRITLFLIIHLLKKGKYRKCGYEQLDTIDTKSYVKAGFDG